MFFLHKILSCSNTSNMTFTLITRSLIIYFLVLILLRMMGKRQIGEMQPFELVITLIIADLATLPMGDTALPLVHGIFPILTLAVVHFILSFLSRKSRWLRVVINGKPIILVGPDGVDFESMKKLNMNFNDLQEGIRGCGYFNLDEILYAIMQTNGTLTVLPRAAYAPLKPNDMQLPVPESSLPIIIVAKGKIVSENVNLAKLDENYIVNQLNFAGIKSVKDVVVATIDTNGKMYIQPKTGKFATVNTSYKGKGNW